MLTPCCCVWVTFPFSTGVCTDCVPIVGSACSQWCQWDPGRPAESRISRNTCVSCGLSIVSNAMFTLPLYTSRDLAITHPPGSPSAGSADLQIPGSKLKGIQPPWVLMPKVVEISLPCVAPWCEGSLFLPSLQGASLHLSGSF